MRFGKPTIVSVNESDVAGRKCHTKSINHGAHAHGQYRMFNCMHACACFEIVLIVPDLHAVQGQS